LFNLETMGCPLLFEINTRCWLRELSQAAGRQISLADIPDEQFESWQRLGFTHIWLMGVWTSGPRSRQRALEIQDLLNAYSEALPGWKPEDVGGSPYAIAAYRVDASLGGEASLASFRRKLQKRGIKLILDFVPNHVGLDHPWVTERPELFVRMPAPGPETFRQRSAAGDLNLAFGKDPNCAPWTDTVQLDYRRAETRAAMLTLLQEVARQCDGVRCDMAMLLLNDVFARTWSRSPWTEPPPQDEFWGGAVHAIKQSNPAFEFLAEVYWGIEHRLQALGFDYTYDKELYDRLVARDAGSVQRHLVSLGADRLRAGAHFLENHDEARISSLLNPQEHRAAALVILGLPGMRFLHEGQLSGYKRRLPVQLVRRALEKPDPEVQEIYDKLLAALGCSAVGREAGELLVPGSAWEQNPTAQNFVLVQWQGATLSFDLVVVNLAPHRGQCYAPVKLPQSAATDWNVRDLLGSETFIRRTEDLQKRGLYLDLAEHGCQLFRFEPQA
jgi:hypothetical protein